MDDPKPNRHVETAEFAPIRVGGGKRRGWSPLLIVGWAGVLSAIVGLGILGESATGNAPGRIVRPSTVALRTSAAVAPSPVTSAPPDPLAYAISADRTGLIITGTSVAHPVVLVFVSVRTGNGSALAWRSLGVEDPNGGLRRDRSPVFVTHVPVPPSALGSGLIVELTAYDNLGNSLGAVRSIVPSFGRVPPRVDVSFVR